MRPTALPLLLVLPTLLAGCSGTEAPHSPAGGPSADRDARAASGDPVRPDGPDEAVDQEDRFGGDPELARAVERALDSALASGASRDDLRVFSECFLGDALYQVEVFGNGVGVWDGKRQFELSEAEVTDLLEGLRSARFAAMRELYGEAEVEIPIPQDAGPAAGELSATRVVCLVSLRIGEVEKQSIQISKPPRSEELAALAESIFALCREAGTSGATAESLDDGLDKIARGVLAPEVLRVLLHRKPDSPAVASGEPAFLLRIDGGRGSVQTFSVPDGYGDPLPLDLDRSDLVGLAALLAENRPGGFPANLYAGHYTDLVVEVLDLKSDVQARPFTGMTPTTHGETQERFDRVYRRLEELTRRGG